MAKINPQEIPEIDWKIKYGGGRKGAYLTVTKDELEAQATVLGWLDSDRQVTTRKKAHWLVAQTWGGDTPKHFVINISNLNYINGLDHWDPQ